MIPIAMEICGHPAVEGAKLWIAIEVERNVEQEMQKFNKTRINQ